MLKLLVQVGIFFLLSLLLVSISDLPVSIWKLESGQIAFLSDAPLEDIEAQSTEIQGLINPAKRTFAFLVYIDSFEGFNSPLQRHHFNENYLESNRFPTASFKGRIIEKIDLETDGTYTIRAKGILNIHGIEQERIIKSEVIIREEVMRISSYFTIPLEDHNITIPRIVNQKIAEKMQVNISATFQQVEYP